MAPRTSWHALSGPPGPVRAIEGTKPDIQIRCTGPGGPLKACHDHDDRLPNPKCDCPGPDTDLTFFLPAHQDIVVFPRSLQDHELARLIVLSVHVMSGHRRNFAALTWI